MPPYEYLPIFIIERTTYQLMKPSSVFPKYLRYDSVARVWYWTSDLSEAMQFSTSHSLLRFIADSALQAEGGIVLRGEELAIRKLVKEVKTVYTVKDI